VLIGVIYGELSDYFATTKVLTISVLIANELKRVNQVNGNDNDDDGVNRSSPAVSMF
jgi:hypothetical protein